MAFYIETHSIDTGLNTKLSEPEQKAENQNPDTLYERKQKTRRQRGHNYELLKT